MLYHSVVHLKTQVTSCVNFKKIMQCKDSEQRKSLNIIIRWRVDCRNEEVGHRLLHLWLDLYIFFNLFVALKKGRKKMKLNNFWLAGCRYYFYWQEPLSGWKVAINTLTESADRVIIRLTPYVILRVSKPHSYLSVENNSMSKNITETELFLMLKYHALVSLNFFKCPC